MEIILTNHGYEIFFVIVHHLIYLPLNTRDSTITHYTYVYYYYICFKASCYSSIYHYMNGHVPLSPHI